MQRVLRRGGVIVTTHTPKPTVKPTARTCMPTTHLLGDLSNNIASTNYHIKWRRPNPSGNGCLEICKQDCKDNPECQKNCQRKYYTHNKLTSCNDRCDVLQRTNGYSDKYNESDCRADCTLLTDPDVIHNYDTEDCLNYRISGGFRGRRLCADLSTECFRSCRYDDNECRDNCITTYSSRTLEE